MKNTPDEAFHYTVNERNEWPPRGRPEPPFGPTAIEVMRSCSLRVCFEFSKGYERRTAYAARIGIAFHRTLQSLTEHPIESSLRSDILKESTDRFRVELAKQDHQKSLRPREQTLPRADERIQRALEAITAESLRLTDALSEGKLVQKTQNEEIPFLNENFPTNSIGTASVLVEIPVQSLDGLLTGRIDYAERLLGGGIRLLDYKSALRSDVPERYERQLQLYVLLWYETFGEWPVEALVVYPFTRTVHTVSIDADTCQRIGEEARQIAQKMQDGLSAEQLASPGDVCSICEFRPWCKPFWRWQAREPVHSQALKRATHGFEGTLLSIEQKEAHWKIKMKWRNVEIRMVVPQEQFPHLSRASAGMRLRVLNMRLHGQRYAPQAIATEYSEIFLVDG